MDDLSHKGSACSLDTSGQSDRKGVNSSPISGVTVNLHESLESVGNSDVSKSPVLNRSSTTHPQDEWQKKLYKNKGTHEFFRIMFVVSKLRISYR